MRKQKPKGKPKLRKRKQKPARKRRPQSMRASAVPAAMSYRIAQSDVQYTPIAKGQIVSNTENITNLAFSNLEADFAAGLNTFNINAGNANLFPWLSGVARQYEFYRFRKLIVHFVPEVGTLTGGATIIGADYDPSDAEPASSNQLMSYSGAVRANIWAPCKWAADIRNMYRQGTAKYVSNIDAANPLASSGNLYVSFRCNLLPGMIRVEYVVELTVPQQRGVGGALSFGGVARFAALADRIVSSNVSSGSQYKMFENVTASVDTTGADLTISDGNVTLPAGFWEIVTETTSGIESKQEGEVGVQVRALNTATSQTTDALPYQGWGSFAAVIPGSDGLPGLASGSATNYLNIAVPYVITPMLKWFFPGSTGDARARASSLILRYLARYNSKNDVNGDPIVP